eukprot:PhM_4_TR387/c0_g1_i1/m.104440/K11786/STH1_SNF2; ATP-dependent helicase STH1/SNF2
MNTTNTPTTALVPISHILQRYSALRRCGSVPDLVADRSTKQELAEIVAQFRLATRAELNQNDRASSTSFLSPQERDLLHKLMTITATTTISNNNSAIITPKQIAEIHASAEKCGPELSRLVPQPPLPPHVVPSHLFHAVDVLKKLPPAVTTPIAPALDDDLVRLQKRVRENVFQQHLATLHAERRSLKERMSRNNKKFEKAKSSGYNSVSARPMYEQRHEVFRAVFHTYYKRSVPFKRECAVRRAALLRDMSTRGAELLQKRQQRRLKSLKEEDLVAYTRILDKEKLGKFMYIMRRTDQLLESIGAKFVDNDPATATSNNTASPALFTSAQGTSTYEQLTHYTSNLKRTYELVHKNQVVVEAQPKLLTGGTLKSFQLAGLRWLVSLYKNNVNGILADLMGLGKTVQTIALLCYVIEVEKRPGPHLVFCPLSLVQQWVEEFAEWAPAVRVKALEIKDRGNILESLRNPFPSLRVVATGASSSGQQTYHGINILNKAARDGGFCNVVVAARNELSRTGGARLETQQWGYVVMDEGHAASNLDSRMTQRLRAIPSTHRLLLTGTPMKNRVEELWALLNYINPRVFSDAQSFLDVFTAPLRGCNNNSSSTVAQDLTLSEEERTILIMRLHQVIRPFMLRRTPEDTGEVLPTKSTHRILCRMSVLQTKLYELAEQRLEAYFPPPAADGSVNRHRNPNLRRCFNRSSVQTLIASHPAATDFIDDILIDLMNDEVPGVVFESEENRRAALTDLLIRSSGKFVVLDNILRRLVPVGRKAVVFAQRLNVIDLLERFLEHRNISFVTLKGDVAREERRVIVDAFAGPDVSVFIASMKSGGQGVDGLQVADTGIFFDMDYTPANDEQAQHRLCRFGQKNHVRIIYLTCAVGVEMRRLNISEAKRQNISDVIQDGGYGGGEDDADDDDPKGKENSADDDDVDGLDNENNEASKCDVVATPEHLDKLFPCNGKKEGEADLAVASSWSELPAFVHDAMTAAEHNYHRAVSGAALENFGIGKRQRDEYVVARDIPLERLERALDRGLTEEEAEEEWERHLEKQQQRRDQPEGTSKNKKTKVSKEVTPPAVPTAPPLAEPAVPTPTAPSPSILPSAPTMPRALIPIIDDPTLQSLLGRTVPSCRNKENSENATTTGTTTVLEALTAPGAGRQVRTLQRTAQRIADAFYDSGVVDESGGEVLRQQLVCLLTKLQC